MLLKPIIYWFITRGFRLKTEGMLSCYTLGQMMDAKLRIRKVGEEREKKKHNSMVPFLTNSAQATLH